MLAEHDQGPRQSGMNRSSKITRIEARRRLLAIDWRELWAYRELLYFLIWRDVKIRYKQTALGAAWAVLQPALTMVVFTVVFGRFVGVPSHGVPYPLFSLAGLLPWQYLTSAVGRSGASVVSSSSLISKVYFPRLLIPVAAAAAPIVDLLVGLAFLCVMMAGYGYAPSSRVVFLPCFILLAFLASLAVSLSLSALNVRYRDVTFLIPFFLQIWMFVSPVVYPSSIVPAKLRQLFALNPAAGIVDGFRWCMLSGAASPLPSMLPSVMIVLALLAGGVIHFHATEDTFSDTI